MGTMIKVMMEKPDMDTCLTALLLGVSDRHAIEVCPEGAGLDDLFDRETLCIECGGSGLIHLNNFDHHGDVNLPPACIQALTRTLTHKTVMLRLVDYVGRLDIGAFFPRPSIFPSLSHIFSGLRLIEVGNLNQFIRGIDMLRQVLDQGLDPYGPMPVPDKWQPYMEAKKCNLSTVEKSMETAQFFQTDKGRKIGVLEHTGIGGTGNLFAKGCDIALLHHSCFGEPSVSKYTIASRNVRVYSLVQRFKIIETGWGGHPYIIGSPRGKGTILSTQMIIRMIVKYL